MSVPSANTARNASRAVWLKHLHQWHWVSSAMCLLCMVLFSVTDITLNHASQIEAKLAAEQSRSAELEQQIVGMTAQVVEMTTGSEDRSKMSLSAMKKRSAFALKSDARALFCDSHAR